MNTESPGSEPIERVRMCKNVRSNKSFYANGPAKIDEYDCGIVWCAVTNNGKGPDSRIADVSECIPGRQCYER